MITEDDRFSEVWPSVFADVVRNLRRRGIELYAAEDAAQEAGTRAFDLNVPFRDAADLRRWVYVVARRITIDEGRKAARIDGSAPVDRRADSDVPAEAEGRLRLAAVYQAFPRLSATERDAIVSDGKPNQTRKEGVMMAVRRHRARVHLLQLMEGVAAILLVAWRRAARPATVAALAVTPIVAVLLVTGGSVGPVDGADRAAGGPRVGASAVVTAASHALSDASAGRGTGDTPPPVDAPVVDPARTARPEGGPAPIAPPEFEAGVPRPGGDGDISVTGTKKDANQPFFCAAHRQVDVSYCAPSEVEAVFEAVFG